jgi:serine/threonine-protein kinase
LSFAHARNVIHRDIKPANIMLGEHGEVYLMDWGIARVPERNQLLEPADRKATSVTAFAFEKEGMVLGTYAYMSPEQARGDVDAMDARTDVFGLGAVLFRLVAGQPPIQGKNPLDALARAGSGQIVDVTEVVQGRLRRALLNVALQAMRSKPDERFSSVVALKRAIEGVMKGGTRFAIQRFAPGTMIVEEGSMGTDAYIMRSGECDVVHGSGSARVLMGRLEPGAVFGETAVFTGQPRNASVIAVTDVELWVVPGSVLEDELNLDTWLGAFVRSLGQRFTEASARAVQMETALLRERIARCAFAALARTQTATVAIADVAAAAGLEATRAQELLAKDIAFVVVPAETGALVRLA